MMVELVRLDGGGKCERGRLPLHLFIRCIHSFIASIHPLHLFLPTCGPTMSPSSGSNHLSRLSAAAVGRVPISVPVPISISVPIVGQRGCVCVAGSAGVGGGIAMAGGGVEVVGGGEGLGLW